MKMAVLALVSLLGIARDCGGDDAGGGGTTTPNAGTEVSEQVYGTWACTANARPPITFEVKQVKPSGVEQQWISDGEQGIASVHLDALYLESFKGIAYDDYGYTEQPKGTLAALDEFGSAAGTAPYHCIRK